MKIIVTVPFQHSDDGHTIKDYAPSTPPAAIEVSEACARMAISEGKATDEAGNAFLPESPAAGKATSSQSSDAVQVWDWATSKLSGAGKAPAAGEILKDTEGRPVMNRNGNAVKMQANGELSAKPDQDETIKAAAK